MLQRLVLDDARDADQMPARVVMFRGDGVCMLSLSTPSYQTDIQRFKN